MELQGTVHNVGAIETRGTDFKVAEIILDRKSIYQGKEYPNFAKVVLQGNKTELLATVNPQVGDYVEVSGDIQGRFFDYQGEKKFAQDFVIWGLKVIRKNESQQEPQKTNDVYS